MSLDLCNPIHKAERFNFKLKMDKHSNYQDIKVSSELDQKSGMMKIKFEDIAISSKPFDLGQSIRMTPEISTAIQNSKQDFKSSKPKKIVCKFCGEKGHYEKECDSPYKAGNNRD